MNEQSKTSLSAKRKDLLAKWKSGNNTHNKIQRLYKKSMPLSYSQQRLWFFEQLFTNTPIYNMYFALQVKGDLNVEILREAIHAIIERHEILRICISVKNGQPVQTVLEKIEVPIQILDFTKITNQENIYSFLVEKARESFDLQKAPLMRFYLLRLGDKKWIFLTIMHHLIADGWSLEIFFRELENFYTEFLAGKSLLLSDLNIQYTDYVSWQNDYFQGKTVTNQLNYWRDYLDGEISRLEIPIDKPRPLIPSYNGDRYYLAIPKKLTMALKSLGMKYQATLFMVLLTTLKILLYRYTGSSDIAIGTPIANRRKVELENLIGLFVNTLVVRADLSGSPSFLTLLKQVKKVAADVYAHQDIPFEKVVEDLHPNRNFTSSPLFNVVFVLHNTPRILLKLPNMQLKPLRLHNRTSKFEFLLTLTEDENGLNGAIEYSTDIFTVKTIKQFTSHYINLLGKIVENPALNIDQYQLLTCEEMHQFKVNIKAQSLVSYISGSTIDEIFMNQAKVRPNKTAIIFADKRYSYEDLDRKTNQFARYLIHHGVKIGDYVGLAMKVSYELIVAILGVLKTGAAYVPLDVNSPKERFAFIFHDANLKWLIVDSEFSSEINSGEVNIINVHLEQKEIAKQVDARVDLNFGANEVAYMIYTSGSTGKPKGVPIRHYNVARLFSATHEWFKFNSQDVWSLCHSYAFDFSVWEIWGALFYGGSLVLVPEKIRKSLDVMYALLVRERVTILNQTPSSFQQLMHIDERYEYDKLSSLRFIIFGGAPLEIQSLKPWFDRHGDKKPCLINMFGITETTVHVTYRPIKISDLNLYVSPIGVPIPDLQIYLLDKYLQPVPRNVIGEMYVGGAGVAHGYYNREDLTHERFINNPFLSKKQKDCLYKTGDLARYTHDGELEYVGRSDRQVKVRGYRIELGEIENTLLQHPIVDQCVVLIKQDGFLKTNKLVGYVILKKQIEEKNHDKQTYKWQIVFDESYADSSEIVDPSFNISGWLSSYTREPLLQKEMHEWVDNTVGRILKLKPEKVLEVGCGTGMLLAKVALNCSEYYATDISQMAINYVNDKLVNKQSALRAVKLYRRSANNFTGIPSNHFDLFVLNSVCQYFPSIEYFVEVIKLAANSVKNAGFLFIGDVRNHDLAEIFHASVVISNLSDNCVDIEWIRKSIKSRMLQDNELTISPKFFYRLMNQIPRISHVAILHKAGRFHNELNCFRYDVILYVNATSEIVDYNILDWQQENFQFQDLTDYLEKLDNKQTLIVKNIPNRRLVRYYDLLQKLKDDQCKFNINELQEIDGFPNNNYIDPNDIYILGEAKSKAVWVTDCYSSEPNTFTAVFSHSEFENRPLSTEIYSKLHIDASRMDGLSLHNQPMNAQFCKNCDKILYNYLHKKLPEYMVPKKFILMGKYPLTVNGKLDYNAFPDVEKERNNLTVNYVVPKNFTEEKVEKAFTQILGINFVGRDGNFFDLGGHSLLATRLIFMLESVFSCKIPLRLILLNPTVKDLAKSILQLQKQNKINSIEELEGVDFDYDIKLDPKIKLTVPQPTISSEMKSVLLTGSTGFVGIYILRELLEQTSANIYCLVRADDSAHAWNRLKSQLNKYFLWKEVYEPRIKVVVGDLAKENLGIEDLIFKELASDIDVIYHNAAIVNFTYHYNNLKNANVNGTEEILRFAVNAKLKRVHYVSSLYVFSAENCGLCDSITEQKIPSNSKGLKLGYTQSKCISEKIIELARRRGLPVSIYRLGRVGGDSCTGACQTNDFFWEIVRVGIRIGCLPRLNLSIDISPVDYIGKAIVCLSQLQGCNYNFHLFNNNPLSFDDFLEQLQATGYKVKVVDFATWKEILLDSTNLSALDISNDVYRLLPIISHIDAINTSIKFDNEITRELLTANEINFPSVANLIKPTISYFIKTGYW